MKMTTIAMELAKEELVKSVKEAAKTAEHLTELGKISDEVKAEHISLGKVSDSDCEKQIGFSDNNEDIFKSEGENKLHNSVDVSNDNAEYDVMLEPLESPQIAFQGGLSACNYKCVMSYCYPVNIAKGIGTKNPHAANSKVGNAK